MSVAPADGELAPRRSWARRGVERVLARPGRSSLLPLAAVVLGLVLAALGMFRGAPAPLAEVPPGYVALVNQKGVLLSDLIAQVENATMKRFDEATPEEKRRVLHSMIDEELLVQRALLLDLPETTIEVREAMQQGVEAQVAEPYWALPPTDAELRAYYAKTRADYTNDGTMIVHDLVLHVGGFQNANQSTPQALSDAAHVLDAEAFEIAHGFRRAAAESIEEQEPAQEAVAAAHARDRAVVVRHRGRRDAELLEQVRPAKRNLRAVVGSRDAEAAELASVVELEALAGGHGARCRAA